MPPAATSQRQMAAEPRRSPKGLTSQVRICVWPCPKWVRALGVWATTSRRPALRGLPGRVRLPVARDRGLKSDAATKRSGSRECLPLLPLRVRAAPETSQPWYGPAAHPRRPTPQSVSPPGSPDTLCPHCWSERLPKEPGNSIRNITPGHGPAPISSQVSATTSRTD